MTVPIIAAESLLPSDDRTTDQKLAELRRVVRELGSVAVAFSAGIESTLVAYQWVTLDLMGYRTGSINEAIGVRGLGVGGHGASESQPPAPSS